MMEDINGLVDDDHFVMKKDDVMLLYTDGITEAWIKGSVQDQRDPEIDMYGDERLVNIFKENGEKDTETIKDELIASLENYSYSDDITFLVLKKTSPPKTKTTGIKKVALPIKKIKPDIKALPATPAKLKKLRATIKATIKITTPEINFFVSSGRENRPGFLSFSLNFFKFFLFFFISSSSLS